MGARMLLVCGCDVPFSEATAFAGDTSPQCPRHGPQAVARVLGLRPPKFRGHCTGPHATAIDLAPYAQKFVETKDS
jgi:hypothetical protein